MSTTAAKRLVTVAELRALGETDLGTSPWFTIEQLRVDQFADATDDHQWIHVDPVKAAEGPFGTTIAHGYLTLSLIPRLLEELLLVTDQVRGANYGLDRTRFTHPVPVGSEINLTGQLIEVRERPDGGVLFKVHVEVGIRGIERPALVADCSYLTYDS